MKVNEEDLKKINKQMQGWKVLRVDSGINENLFIITLTKGKNTKTITLCGNDLGGWIK